LFIRANPSLHLLTDGIPRADYFLVPKAAEASTTYINCLGRGDRPFIDNRSPVLAETDTLIEYLDGRGFLRRRLRATIATRTPLARTGYDEAWYYAAVHDVLPHGEPLPSEIEGGALAMGRSSWPLSWILARYFAGQDTARVDELALQFADLVATESDLARLARYHGDVESTARQVVKACGPKAVDRVVDALVRVFGLTVKPRTRVGAANPNR
jgi:hypothetical protein